MICMQRLRKIKQFHPLSDNLGFFTELIGSGTLNSQEPMESMLTKPLICLEIRFDYRLAMKIFLNKVIGTLLHGPVLFLKREFEYN